MNEMASSTCRIGKKIGGPADQRCHDSAQAIRQAHHQAGDHGSAARDQFLGHDHPQRKAGQYKKTGQKAPG